MTDPTATLVALVRERLAESPDPGRADRMQAYMKSAMPFRGVPARPLARLCNELFDAHRLDEASWHRAVGSLWDEATASAPCSARIRQR